MNKQSRIYIKAALIVMSILCAAKAQAGLKNYSFMGITHNSASNTAIGEDQLLVMVSGDDGGSQVTFKFVNEGPAECAITEIYFQDGSLLAFASIDESLDEVDFKEEEMGNVNPKNLPGGKSIDPEFIATTAFSVEPVNPEPYWGVEPGEWLAITYTLEPEKTYGTIIQELNNSTLRIGIHVQGFDDGGSESFVTPEPGTMALLGFGGLMMKRRRKYKIG